MVAIGQEMGHHGRQPVKIWRLGCCDVVGLGFEVTDVTRPFIVVVRIVEKGSAVHFDETAGWARIASRCWESPLELEGGCSLRRTLC